MNNSIGSTYPLQLLILSSGVGVTGQSPTVILQRLSDSLYWNGSTSFSPTIAFIPMTEVDSVNQPGLYQVVFNQAVDNTAQTYTAYYSNPTFPYQGSSVEELVFANSVANVNNLAIASAVASKLFVNPAIPIDTSDIASQNTLLSVLATDTTIEQNMAQEATLLSGLDVIENDLTEIISILQPTSGSNNITFSFTDQNSNPIPGIKTTVMNTLAQITLAVGTSDTNGRLTLGLPNGTFKILFFKSFIQFPTMPYTLVVNGDATVVIPCTTFQPTAPSPNTCAIFCYLVDASGQPIPNISVRGKVVSNFPNSPASSMLATKEYVESISDASGYIQLNLMQGTYVEISAPALFLTITDYLVPAVASLDLSTLLSVTS